MPFAFGLGEHTYGTRTGNSVVDIVLVTGRCAPCSYKTRAYNTSCRACEIFFTGTALLRSRTAAQYHGNNGA